MTDPPTAHLDTTIRTARDQACNLLAGLTRAYTDAESSRRTPGPAWGAQPDVGRARLRRAIDQTQEVIGRLDRAIDEADAGDLARSQRRIENIAHELDKLVRYV